jgi:hypothetical protein
MNWFRSKFCLFLIGTIGTAQAQELKETSFKIVPSHWSAQFAGAMGVVAAGPGWDYGKKKRWSTEFLVGYVPKFDTEKVKFTLNVRQTYTPWGIDLTEDLRLHPLRTGLFINTTIGKEFWLSSPEKYPGDYYTFSTKIRWNIFLGQELSLRIKSKAFESVRFFYDVHTSDLYVMSRVQNRYLAKRNYLGLALGAKLQLKRK